MNHVPSFQTQLALSLIAYKFCFIMFDGCDSLTAHSSLAPHVLSTCDFVKLLHMHLLTCTVNWSFIVNHHTMSAGYL